MSSNRGIYRVSKQDLNDFAANKRKTITSIAYGTIDGMLNAECNGGLSLRALRRAMERCGSPPRTASQSLTPKSSPAICNLLPL